MKLQTIDLVFNWFLFILISTVSIFGIHYASLPEEEPEGDYRIMCTGKGHDERCSIVEVNNDGQD